MARQEGSPQVAPQFAHQPAQWNAGWLAAKAASGTTPAWVTFIGDSISCGQNPCSDVVAKAFPGLVRASLAAAYGAYADFYDAYGLSSWPTAGTNNNAPWSGVLNALTAADSDAFAWTHIPYVGSGLTAAYHQRFTSPYACTAMDLLYLDYNAGTFKYSVDGGADVTVTCTGNGSAASAEIKRISLSALANQVHTIDLGKQSVGAVCIPVGVVCYAGTTGIGVGRVSAGGLRGDHYDSGTQTQYPADRCRLISGINPNKDGGTTYGTFGFPTAPHLAVIELGPNDCSNLTNTTYFENTLRRFCQALRRGRSNCSILFLIPCNPDSAVSDSTGLANSDSWITYVESQYKIARMFNAAVLNIHAKWAETPKGAGFHSATNPPHPTDAGHSDIANAILAVI